MRERGTTVVLGTPLVEDVAAVCDEVVVLARGRTLFSGTTRALAGHAGAGAVDDPPDAEQVGAGYRRLLTGATAVSG
jgi:ABC-2 type transport system ATP-binding protein